MSDPVNPDSKPAAAPEPTPYASAPEPTPYAAGNPYSSSAAPAKTAVLSLISLIAGILGIILGFFGWGALFSIGAVVLGHMGQRKEKHAKAMWLTGLITGYAGILLNLLIVGAVVLALVLGLSAAESYQP
jgi:ABC-type phosphate transport system permease subunit